MTLWSRNHFSKVLVSSLSALWACCPQMEPQVVLSLRPKLATKGAAQGLLGGALPQVKFSCPAQGPGFLLCEVGLPVSLGRTEVRRTWQDLLLRTAWAAAPQAACRTSGQPSSSQPRPFPRGSAHSRRSSAHPNNPLPTLICVGSTHTNTDFWRQVQGWD